MLRFFSSFLGRLAAPAYLLKVERALSLHHRGEVRRDGLRLKNCESLLKIEWYARDIHPWDRLDSSERRAALFVSQCIADTVAAIGRLFRILPEIDAISLVVREQNSQHVIMAGTVHRSAHMPDTKLSLGMQLRDLGIRFLSDGFRFEPLSLAHEQCPSCSEKMRVL